MSVLARASHAPSWYAATAHPHRSYPALTGEVRCDVAVIGAGFTGLSAALDLAERGYDVVVLEAERVGWGASGRNGGQILSGFNKAPSTIAHWVGREDARRLWELSEEAKALLCERVARYGIRCDLRRGHLTAALKPRHMAELAAYRDELEGEYGYRQLRLVGPDEMREMVQTTRYVGGLLDAGGGHLHPLNYALGLAEAAVRAGARIHEGSRVVRIDTGATVTAQTAGGRVRARYLLLAGNAYLGGLVPAIRGKITPVATYLLATEPLGANRARALIPGDLAVADANVVVNYYRRSADHRLLFGGGASYSGLDRPDLARALRRAMLRVFPQLADAEIAYCWGGHVAITMDRTPHFGRLAPNVFFAQGYSGQGVALAGLGGRLMAEAVAGTAERFDVFARLPHRTFPGGPMLRRPALVLAMLYYRLRDLL